MYLKFFISELNRKYEKEIEKIHKSKLNRLGIQHQFSLPPKDVIFNLSSKILSRKEELLLSLGLDFNLPVYKLNYFRYFVEFEKLLYFLKQEQTVNLNVDTKRLTNEIKVTALKYFYKFNPHKIFNLLIKRPDLEILKNLGRDNSIVITKPDKGRGVVVLNKTDYIEKMNVILSDKSKFEETLKDPIKINNSIEDKLNNFIAKLKRNNIHSLNQFSVSGTSPGILYGSPKIHKTNTPLRPILAAYNTTTYKLAKFIVNDLNKISSNEYTVRDSFHFIDEVKNSNLNPNQYYLVSFDVVSLFTNVPIDETINIIIKKLFPNDQTLIHELNSKYYREILVLISKYMYFFFNEKLYKQIDGVSMGSPIGPAFANIFMCHLEEKMMSTCPNNCRPIIYKRYVDDTFAAFDNKEKALAFLNYINSLHSNIKFTMDEENNSSLPFLDVNIIKTNNCFEFAIFRKRTFTGLATNFFSFSPLIYKINAIKTLVHRGFSISSTYFKMHLEFESIRNLFFCNGYPIRLIEKLLKNT